mmetsp:Transcript_70176/g.195265  ORF Transcript_70176/g.195265 Transcript_70176/m.195265 type:complete len:680 (+) Transcript_70176:172-2211(+)
MSAGCHSVGPSCGRDAPCSSCCGDSARGDTPLVQEELLLQRISKAFLEWRARLTHSQTEMNELVQECEALEDTLRRTRRGADDTAKEGVCRRGDLEWRGFRRGAVADGAVHASAATPRTRRGASVQRLGQSQPSCGSRSDRTPERRRAPSAPLSRSRSSPGGTPTRVAVPVLADGARAKGEQLRSESRARAKGRVTSTKVWLGANTPAQAQSSTAATRRHIAAPSSPPWALATGTGSTGRRKSASMGPPIREPRDRHCKHHVVHSVTCWRGGVRLAAEIAPPTSPQRSRSLSAAIGEWSTADVTPTSPQRRKHADAPPSSAPCRSASASGDCSTTVATPASPHRRRIANSPISPTPCAASSSGGLRFAAQSPQVSIDLSTNGHEPPVVIALPPTPLEVVLAPVEPRCVTRLPKPKALPSPPRLAAEASLVHGSRARSVSESSGASSSSVRISPTPDLPNGSQSGSCLLPRTGMKSNGGGFGALKGTASCRRSSPTTAISDDPQVQANIAFQAKDYARAVELFTRAISVEPENYVLFSDRAICLAVSGHYTESLRDSRRCVELRPDWPRGYGRRGLAEFCLGAYDEAAESYRIGLRLAPDDPALREGLQQACDARRSFASVARIGGGPTDASAAAAAVGSASARAMQEDRSFANARVGWLRPHLLQASLPAAPEPALAPP